MFGPRYSEGHVRKLVQTKRSGDCRLRSIWLYALTKSTLHKFAARYGVRKIMDVANRIPVRDRPSVEHPVVITRAPAIVSFRRKVKWWCPRTLRRSGRTFDSMASNSCLAIFSFSGARRRGVQTTEGPDVVRMWCTVLCGSSVYTSWSRYLRKLI